MPRDDFTRPVKEALAKRVGLRCSNPNCRKLTAGPHTRPARALNVGVAAHITAASEGGPRYDPSLTRAKRKLPENGIWLCQNCAKLIDNDEERYPLKVLREWKEEAEREALDQVVGSPGPHRGEDRERALTRHLIVVGSFIIALSIVAFGTWRLVDWFRGLFPAHIAGEIDGPRAEIFVELNGGEQQATASQASGVFHFGETVEPGRHNVEYWREGYHRMAEPLRVVGGRQNYFSLPGLVPENQPPPEYSQKARTSTVAATVSKSGGEPGLGSDEYDKIARVFSRDASPAIEGWIYLGSWARDGWIESTFAAGEGLPQEGETIALDRHLLVRRSKPRPMRYPSWENLLPEYGQRRQWLGREIGALGPGQVVVERATPVGSPRDPDGKLFGHVWAKVRPKVVTREE